jgi:hypothetical protein
MNKKHKSNIQKVAIVVVLLFLFVILFKNAERLSTFNKTPYQTFVSIASQDANSATYRMDFSIEPIEGDCSGEDSVTISFGAGTTQSMDDRPAFIEGVPENVPFDASDVQFDGIRATIYPCSDNEQEVDVVVDDASAKCSINKILFEDNNVADMSCAVTGTVHAEKDGVQIPAKFSGLSGGYVVVTYDFGTQPPIKYTWIFVGILLIVASVYAYKRFKL